MRTHVNPKGIINRMSKNPFKIRLPPNRMGKDYVIGDLHGTYDELLKLMDFVNFNEAYDRLFCVGDLIHRGLQSDLCLELLKKKRLNGDKWFYSTIGNHDVFEDQELDSFAKYQVDTSQYYLELTSLPFMYEVEHDTFGYFWVTHGELDSQILFGRSRLSNEYNKNVQDNNEDIIMPNKNNLNADINFFIQSLDNLNNVDKIQNKQNILKVAINMINEDMLNKDYTDTIKSIILNPQWQPSKKEQLKSIWSRSLLELFFIKYRHCILNNDFSFLNTYKERADKLKIFCGHSLVPFPMSIGNQIYCDTGACFGYHLNAEDILKNFSFWGKQFFGLSLIDIDMGDVYTCISSQKPLMLPAYQNNLSSDLQRGDIVKLEMPLYKNIFDI